MPKLQIIESDDAAFEWTGKVIDEIADDEGSPLYKVRWDSTWHPTVLAFDKNEKCILKHQGIRYEGNVVSHKRGLVEIRWPLMDLPESNISADQLQDWEERKKKLPKWQVSKSRSQTNAVGKKSAVG